MGDIQSDEMGASSSKGKNNRSMLSACRGHNKPVDNAEQQLDIGPGLAGIEWKNSVENSLALASNNDAGTPRAVCADNSPAALQRRSQTRVPQSAMHAEINRQKITIHDPIDECASQRGRTPRNRWLPHCRVPSARPVMHTTAGLEGGCRS